VAISPALAHFEHQWYFQTRKQSSQETYCLRKFPSKFTAFRICYKNWYSLEPPSGKKSGSIQFCVIRNSQ